MPTQAARGGALILKRAPNSERSFNENANRSMDQLRQSSKDNDKYFDLVIPKQSLDSFNVEKLKEMRSQLKKLQNDDLMQKL